MATRRWRDENTNGNKQARRRSSPGFTQNTVVAGREEFQKLLKKRWRIFLPFHQTCWVYQQLDWCPKQVPKDYGLDHFVPV